jgi:UPF0755 protein
METGKSMSGKRRAHGLGIFLGTLAGILILAAIACTIAFFLSAEPSAKIPPKGLYVVIREGAGAALVGRDLEDSGAIRSRLAFRLLARLRGDESALKSGTYLIEPDMGTWQVLDLIVSGKQALVRVTVPEGYTLSQTAAVLEKYGICKASDFKAVAGDAAFIASLSIKAPSLEGYLFPDTYYFPPQFDAKEAARMMVEAFRTKLEAAMPEAGLLSGEELQEKVILASIIEREYRVPAEAPLMASVFYNRLRIRMALQSCATVVYVITEKQGKPHPEVIYDRDLAIPDDYNTYSHRGLPPGPICSPGLTALGAVFHPAASKYLYFRLIDPAAGTHHFSETLEEHNEATALAVKRVGGQ